MYFFPPFFEIEHLLKSNLLQKDSRKGWQKKQNLQKYQKFSNEKCELHWN